MTIGGMKLGPITPPEPELKPKRTMGDIVRDLSDHRPLYWDESGTVGCECGNHFETHESYIDHHPVLGEVSRMTRQKVLEDLLDNHARDIVCEIKGKSHTAAMGWLRKRIKGMMDE